MGDVKRRARRRPAAKVTVCEARYSMAEAAEVASLGKRTIEAAVAEGQQTGGVRGIWPLEVVGRRVLIPASSLDGWLRGFRLGEVA